MRIVLISILILSQLNLYSQIKNEKMKYQSTTNSNLKARQRVIDLNISTPKIRAEFYVRLFSLLNVKPETSYEGYEFFIKDTETGLEFSAALTGFGVGYFAENNSPETLKNINEFNYYLFNQFKDLKECTIELENDFGKSIFGFKNNEIIEIDTED